MGLTTSPVSLPAAATTTVFFMDDASPWSSAPTLNLSGVSGASIGSVTKLTAAICKADVTTPAGVLGMLTVTDAGTSRTTTLQVGELLRASVVQAAAARAKGMNPQLAAKLADLAEMLAFVETGTAPALSQPNTVFIDGVAYPRDANALPWQTPEDIRVKHHRLVNGL